MRPDVRQAWQQSCPVEPQQNGFRNKTWIRTRQLTAQGEWGVCWKVRPLANDGWCERGNQCSFHIKQPLFLWKLQVRSKICSAIFPLSLFPTCKYSFFHHQRSCQSDEGVIRDGPTRIHRCLSKSIALFISHEIGETYNDMYIHATIRSSTILYML